MAQKKIKKRKYIFGEKSELAVTDRIYNEFTTAKDNQKDAADDFESIIDILECKRTEKDYEWLSDVFIPEYPSIHLTEASQWANQYFPTRDFVDVYLSGQNPGEVNKANAAKKYINSMLNVRKLYHYHKYMRARGINASYGSVFIVCSWKKKTITKMVAAPEERNVAKDFSGEQIVDQQAKQVPVEVILEDRFHYEVIDPRNVFTDDSYSYSIQDKEWVTIWSELSYEQLKAMEVENGYFNLAAVKDLISEDITELAKETREYEQIETGLKRFDVLERFGVTWAIVTERDEEGYPVKMRPPNPDKNEDDISELVEAIETVVVSGSSRVLIRFQPTPFRTSKNVPFRPVIRGLNYIHPTKDVGMSDAKYGRELQVALNDTINLSNDRVKLATLPTLKVRKYAMDDNDSIFFEPEHMMMVENPDDITEFQISDNMQGALAQAQMFINKMQQVASIYPTTMGDLPGRASTTATAIQGAESRTNLRANYKSLTFEYTFLNELYWMMLQMGYQFMSEKTMLDILGEEAAIFDPDCDFHYQPVSSNIEMEYNKMQKVKNLDQMVGRLSGLVKLMPGVIFPIMKMIHMQFELLGQESQTIAPILDKIIQMGMNQGETEGPKTADAQGAETSNQTGIPVGGIEEQVRGGQMQ